MVGCVALSRCNSYISRFVSYRRLVRRNPVPQLDAFLPIAESIYEPKLAVFLPRDKSVVTYHLLDSLYALPKLPSALPILEHGLVIKDYFTEGISNGTSPKFHEFTILNRILDIPFVSFCRNTR